MNSPPTKLETEEGHLLLKFFNSVFEFGGKEVN